ncbi:MAG: hypothetical protein PHN32_00005 [Actinomycetota bacterium]|jgi:hypothetical protein|nr:hypothetical protein [Actinomycetota bacterium]
MQDVKTGASGMSKGALICGILSIIPGASIAALVLAIIDLVKINKGEAGVEGRKFDIIAIILAVVLPPIFWTIITTLIWGCAAASAMTYSAL